VRSKSSQGDGKEPEGRGRAKKIGVHRLDSGAPNSDSQPALRLLVPAPSRLDLPRNFARPID
jgi:hypothetical protein